MPLTTPTFNTGQAGFGATVFQPMYLERFIAALRLKTGVIYPLGRKSTLPMGAGKSVRWQHVTQPAAITGNVGNEGEDPAETAMTTVTAQATLEEFGAVVPYSRLLMSSAMSGTKEEMLEALGYQAALSIEVRTIDEVDGATTLTVDAGTGMTADALRQGAQKLVNVGSQPNPVTDPYFCFIGSTEACYDMIGEGAPTWVQAKNREIESALLTPLTGSPQTAGIWGCLVKLSQSIKRDTAPSPDDDLNLLIAKDAFGVSDLDFNAAQPQVVDTPPEMSVHVPARNRGYMAWLLFYKAKLIRENSVVVIKSDATGVG